MIKDSGIDLIDGVYCKLERLQPTNSIKFRPAMQMMVAAAERQTAQHDNSGLHILESSSGNTGIAVAQICFMWNIPCTIVVPAGTRQGVLQALYDYKAYIMTSEPENGSDGAKQLAHNLTLESPGKYSYLNQYSNPYNPYSHYRTTGPEIWRQSNNSITHFVAGIGTGGTITGVGQYLKEQDPTIKIIGVQPKDWMGISGLRNIETSFVPEVLDRMLIDSYAFIDTMAAVREYERFNNENFGTIGYSSAANLIVARSIAEHNPEASVFTIFPDDQRRY